MNGRYTALPMISMGLRILGYVVAIFGLIAALYYFFFGVSMPSVAGVRLDVNIGFIRGHLAPAVNALVSAGIRALLLVGAAELIHVLLDIEENTRKGNPARDTSEPAQF